MFNFLKIRQKINFIFSGIQHILKPKKYKKRLIFLGLSLCIFTLFAGVTLAGGDNLPGQSSGWFDTAQNWAGQAGASGVSTRTLKDQILVFINYFLTFLGIVSVAGVVYSGILMVTSIGNEEQFEKGKKYLGYMLIGILIVLLSYSLVNFAINAGGGTWAWGGGTTLEGNGGTGTNDRPNWNDMPGTNNAPTVINNQFDLPNDNPVFLNPDGSVMVNPDGTISFRFDIDRFRRSLDKIAQELADYTFDYSSEINYLKTLLETYLSNPTDRNWQAFTEEYHNFWLIIEKQPYMKPVIIATPSLGYAPLTVALDGLSSTDPTNTTIPDQNYNWFYLNQNNQKVTLAQSATMQNEFTEPGTYVVNLNLETANRDNNNKKTVLDGIVGKRIIVEKPLLEINLRVNNEPVETILRIDTETARAGLTFDISQSDLNLVKEIKRVIWDFGDSYESTERFDLGIIKHAYTEKGEYTLNITMYDDLNRKHSKKVKVVIKDIISNFNIEPTEGDLATEFRFDATDLLPYESRLVENLWQIVDAENNIIVESAKTNFTYRFEKPGTYKASFTIKDTGGTQDTLTKEFYVNSRQPRASFNWKITNPAKPNLVKFDASNSFDPDKDKLTLDWDFNGDGVYEIEDSDELLFEQLFAEIGKYSVVLRVKDPYGKIDIMKKIVTIDSVLNADFAVSQYAAPKNTKLKFLAKSPDSVGFYWDFGDGVILQSEWPQIEHIFTKAGKYQVTLKVFNTQSESNQISKEIFIANDDSPMAVPVLIIDGDLKETTENLCGAGKDGVEIYRSSRVVFRADLSINAAGENFGLDYTWDFGDGVFSNQKSIAHYYSEALPNGQCYKVKLGVKDLKSNQTAQSEPIYIKVINQKPKLQYLEITPLTDLVTPAKFKLYAHGVEDPDGKVLKYRWWYYREGENKQNEIQVTSVPFTEITVMGDGLPGKKHKVYFVVELTDDNNGQINSSELFDSDIAYEVENGKHVSPLVDFTLDKTVIFAGDSVNFFAKASDPSGAEIPKNSYYWDFDGDGEFDDSASGPQVSRRYNIPGEYQVRLKVDLNGLSTSAVKKIIVQKTNTLPLAAFTYVVTGNTVKFDASNSQFDDSIANQEVWYSWDFDTQKDENGNGYTYDDVQGDMEKEEYTYSQEGEYTVRLTIRDSAGTTDYVERKIQVGDSIDFTNPNTQTIHSLQIVSDANLMSSLDVFMPDLILRKGDTVDISARIVQADGEIYNDIVRYKIIEGDGDFIPSTVNAKEWVAQATFKANTPGLIVVEVEAPAILGGSLKETISFNVR